MVQVDRFDFGGHKDAYTLRFNPKVEIGNRDCRSMTPSQVAACALQGEGVSVADLEPDVQARLSELDGRDISPGEVTVVLQEITGHFVSIA